MKHALRLLFGAFWLVFGLNNFFHFFPVPSPAPQAAAFMAALEQTGYVMPLVFATEVLVGVMLLTNRWVPLALLMLAPILANILLYDLFLNQAGLAIGAVLVVIYNLLLYGQRRVFSPLLRATP